ncbi:hypothetical protein H0H87_009387 [Tephrocybe sp. NHM501043]|nr:hypothetical protein H0H87_009387 [Tephrocybe sp. NHM501043]
MDLTGLRALYPGEDLIIAQSFSRINPSFPIELIVEVEEDGENPELPFRLFGNFLSMLSTELLGFDFWEDLIIILPVSRIRFSNPSDIILPLIKLYEVDWPPSTAGRVMAAFHPIPSADDTDTRKSFVTFHEMTIRLQQDNALAVDTESVIECTANFDHVTTCIELTPKLREIPNLVSMFTYTSSPVPQQLVDTAPFSTSRSTATSKSF